MLARNLILFLYNAPTPTAIYTLSLHDALPIFSDPGDLGRVTLDGALAVATAHVATARAPSSRSEEHTSELQSRVDIVCRLLLEKKKNKARNKRLKHDQTPQQKTDSASLGQPII